MSHLAVKKDDVYRSCTNSGRVYVDAARRGDQRLGVSVDESIGLRNTYLDIRFVSRSTGDFQPFKVLAVRSDAATFQDLDGQKFGGLRLSKFRFKICGVSLDPKDTIAFCEANQIYRKAAGFILEVCEKEGYEALPLEDLEAVVELLVRGELLYCVTEEVVAVEALWELIDYDGEDCDGTGE